MIGAAILAAHRVVLVLCDLARGDIHLSESRDFHSAIGLGVPSFHSVD